MRLSLVLRPYLKRSLSSSTAQKVFRFEMMCSDFCSKNLQNYEFIFSDNSQTKLLYTQINVYDFQDIDKLVFFLLLSSIRESIVLKIIIDECWEVLNVYLIVATYNKVCSAESKQYPVQTKNFILMACKLLSLSYIANMYA